MVFKCQEDSFLKQYTSKIVSVDYGTLEWTPPGDTTSKQLRGFNVVCEDTILFPEGGGQPCDYGSINGLPVRQVQRRGSEAVHFVEAVNSSELTVGSPAKQCLDWERRLDNMQQHSGQHLLTALFEREFNYNTISWWLGTSVSYVELETRHLISPESLDTIEHKANELIREGRAVTVLLVDPENCAEAIRARGLPKDHVGLARVVCIDGIENNMCCGTHVNNISQLQCVKLLHAEKTKDSVLVHFVVGERVMRKLGDCYQRELQVNLALKGGPSQHVELIQKLQNNLKAATKSFQKLLKDVAISEAEKLENSPPPLPKYYCLHRRDGLEPDFMQTFLRHAPENIFYFLTVCESTPSGGRGKQGLFILRGDPELITKFGAEFLILLNGKGNGRENTFQGKFQDSSGISECEALLEKHFNPTKTKLNTPAVAS